MKPLRISFDFYQLLPTDTKLKLETFLLADKNFWPGCESFSSPRYGKSKIWDFYHDPDYVLCPTLSQQSTSSFSDVTDLRAVEIKQAMKQQDQEIAVFWSGGIDSTVALAAMVKNFDLADLKNVTVIANNQSYFENPIFYHSVIEKYQLKTVNFKNFSDDKIQDLFDRYYVVDGEPADKLWIVNIAIQFESVYGAGSLVTPLTKISNKFIEFLAVYMSSDQASQYYNSLMQNINEAGVEIVTLGDLFWWINFNFHWVEHLLIWYNQFPVKNSQAYKQYKKNYKPWYNTEQYQLWSLSTDPSP
jgi:diphthamide synthase (EF-2-diphthine--ammonia ligase)